MENIPKKKCPRCGEIKFFTEYNKSTTRKDGIAVYCTECSKIRGKKYYKDNENRRKQIKDRRYLLKLANKQFIKEYLSTHPCVDCGESDPLVLDFDHVQGEKRFNLARGKDYKELKDLKIEIDKCEVRCGNCHRIKTAKERGYYKIYFECIL